jgi:arylsulfatase A-like enzyme
MIRGRARVPGSGRVAGSIFIVAHTRPVVASGVGTERGPSDARRLSGRGILAAAGVFLVLDLWQLALLNPGMLPLSPLLALASLYAVATLLAVVTAAVLHRHVGGRGVAQVATAVALLVISFFVAQQLALLSLPVSLRWRWAVPPFWIAIVVVAWTSARLARGRHPWRLAAVGATLAVLGMMGALRGFSWSTRPAMARGSTADSAAEARRPNVVLVTIDTMRADHLSAYGYSRATSPVLEALAREGVLFERAFAQSSWTKPSTASLLTARYPSMHQLYLEKASLADREVLLPEVLRDHGYRTAVLSGNPWIRPEFGFDQGVDHFFSVRAEGFAHGTLFMTALKSANRLIDAGTMVYNRVKRLVVGHIAPTERDTRLNAEAARWLARQGTQPFFLYLHYMSPHQPYTPPAPFDRTFVPDPKVAPVTVNPRKTYRLFEIGDPLPEERRQDLIARYDGAILFADHVLGELVATLRALDLLDETLVVVTSDHGEEFYEHHNWGHGQSLYNELIHVPLVMRWPARLPGGRRVGRIVRSVDVMPTILELVGIPRTLSMAGRSLLGVVQDENSAGWDEAYAELLFRDASVHALVRGHEKLLETMRDGRLRRELYDLAADFDEQNDLATRRADAPAVEERVAAIHALSGQSSASPSEDAAARRE